MEPEKIAPLLICVIGALLFVLFIRAMIKSGSDEQRFTVSLFRFLLVIVIGTALALIAVAHKYVTGGFE